MCCRTFFSRQSWRRSRLKPVRQELSLQTNTFLGALGGQVVHVHDAGNLIGAGVGHACLWLVGLVGCPRPSGSGGEPGWWVTSRPLRCRLRAICVGVALRSVWVISCCSSMMVIILALVSYIGGVQGGMGAGGGMKRMLASLMHQGTICAYRAVLCVP